MGGGFFKHGLNLLLSGSLLDRVHCGFATSEGEYLRPLLLILPANAPEVLPCRQRLQANQPRNHIDRIINHQGLKRLVAGYLNPVIVLNVRAALLQPVEVRCGAYIVAPFSGESRRTSV